MIAEVTPPAGNINVTIALPSSKSISNRVLIIHALGHLHSSLHNISQANDTLELKKALSDGGDIIDAGDGGTTLRFLMAYYCAIGAEVILTASESLKKRPVSQLVDALRELGAEILYLDEEGKLPVLIKKADLKGKHIAIDGGVSSQFVSALMMIAPYVRGGLTIEITGEMLSLPYINMTRSVMEYFGVQVFFESNIITIPEGGYTDKEIVIEPDWSAASYWYEIAALTNNAEIFLPGLMEDSLQGDLAIADMMNRFGVKTSFTDSGARLVVTPSTPPDYFTGDLSGCPDLGPALAAVCAGLNITADLHGLKNFRLKESDRAAALQRELYNLNVKTDFCGGSKFKIYHGNGIRRYHRPVKTYNDHRIAMCFAPISLKTGSVLIENPEVVNKSYPGFWDDLKLAGFQINEL